jgi:precorrin-6B methylase 2
MLDLAGVGPGNVLYDLGSGDGRILIAAAKRGARAVGIEKNPGRVRLARANALAAGVHVEVIEGDFHVVDISAATVVTMYLWEAEQTKLVPKFETLRPGSRIVSHGATLGDWPVDRSEGDGAHALHLWTVRRVVSLDQGGIGDTLLAMRAVVGSGAAFLAPKTRGGWAGLFEGPSVTHGYKTTLILDDYDRSSGIPRWQHWANECGELGELVLKPLSMATLDWAIPYAGRVVISPFCGVGKTEREWPLDRWLEVNRLLTAAGFTTVVLDSGMSSTKRTAGFAGKRTAILRGKSPEQVAAVLLGAAVFTGNDSGMAHLAGALGIPGLVVRGAASDENIMGCWPSIAEVEFGISPSALVSGIEQAVRSDYRLNGCTVIADHVAELKESDASTVYYAGRGEALIHSFASRYPQFSHVLIPPGPIAAERQHERTMLCPLRLGVLRRLADLAPAGAFAEFGCFEGGVVAALADEHPTRRAYAFDTFEGMPPNAVEEEVYFRDKKQFEPTRDPVSWLSQWPNVRICRGEFPKSITEQADAESFALVHLDADLYASILDGLRFFWPRLVNGGHLVIDDLDRDECPGVRPALDEWFPEWQSLVVESDPANCQVVLRKP